MKATAGSNIVLFNDTSEESHPGCRAAGGQVLAWLQERTNPGRTERFNVHFSWQFHPCPQNYEEIQTLIDSDDAQIAGVRESIDRSDFVVVNGEGTILGSRPPVRNILLFLEIAHQAGKPTALINSTIATLGHPKAQLLMEQILPRVNLICVREVESYALLRKIGCSSTVTATDASFAWLGDQPPVSHASVSYSDSLRNSIVVFGSVQLGWYNYKHLRAFLRSLSLLTGSSFVLVPMTNLEFQIFRKLSTEIEAVMVDGRHGEPHHIVALVENNSLTLTGRYHGAIFSIAAKRPFIHYDTHSGRIQWLCKQMGIELNRARILKGDGSDLRSGAIQRLLDSIEDHETIFASELPFQVQMAELQNECIYRFLEGGYRKPITAEEQLTKDGEHATFNERARMAAAMLEPNLRVLDCGGYRQLFAKYYDYSTYTSIDILGRETDSIVGQPPGDVMVDDLPIADAHVEADLNRIEDFRRFGDFDVAVCLGLLMWLKSWRTFLSRLAGSEIPQVLVSWDEIGVERTTKFLSEHNYERIQIELLGNTTVLARFVRRRC